MASSESAAATSQEQRLVEMLLRNIEMVRDLSVVALEQGESPREVIERALDNIEGFIRGTRAMIVPPDMVPAKEMADAIELGRQLAARYGW